ncbi:MAG: glycosyltransferase family 39 protein, partial [Myxococcales bacterium]|nr:glycosyltransferase family 39 protein [Myxococcales bacterium]
MVRPLAVLLGLLVAGILLAALVVLDGALAHGMDATWYTTITTPPQTAKDHPGNDKPNEKARTERLVVARTVEHRVSFPNEIRPFSRYLQNWSFDDWGVPNRFPDLDVSFDAWLTIPEGPPRTLRVTSPNEVSLVVDGKKTKEPLAPGRHRIELSWKGPAFAADDPHWDHPLPVSFELRWATSKATDEPVPRTALEPASAGSTRSRVALWILGALLTVAFGFGAFLAARRASVHLTSALVFAAILLLGSGLRLFDYASVPDFTDNDDELFATWNGWQLLTDGTTRGWSLWPRRYGRRVRVEEPEYFRQRPFYVIRPYLEHPPLMHVLVGAAAKASGAQHWLHAKLAHTRLVPIALGLLSLGLLFLVGRQLFPRGPTAHLATLLYAILPNIVLQQRVIKEEALVTPLLLGGLLAYIKWREGKRPRTYLALAAICMGLACLAKIPAIVFVPVLVLWLLREGHLRAATIATLIGFGTASLLLVYGAFIHWDLFWYSSELQATVRRTHWNVFIRFFSEPMINHNRIGAGWVLFLWIAFANLLPQLSRHRRHLVGLPVIIYMAAIAIPSGSWSFGWYILPLYPFLCLGGGRFLADLWEEPDAIRGGLFVFLAIFYGFNFLGTDTWLMTHRSTVSRMVPLTAVIFLTPFLLSTLLPTRAGKWIGRVGLI